MCSRAPAKERPTDVQILSPEETRQIIGAAALLRAAMLAKQLHVFAWKDGKETIELDMTMFAGLVQPNDGTVFTLVYLRAASAAADMVPESMLRWLPAAELLLEESTFRRWLRRKRGKGPGRPARIDALELARFLVAEGKWKTTAPVGQLYQLLNERGRLDKPVGRGTATRIANELGYRSRPRKVRESKAHKS